MEYRKNTITGLFKSKWIWKHFSLWLEETRQAVLNRVSKHGGHVGPKLRFCGGNCGSALRV